VVCLVSGVAIFEVTDGVFGEAFIDSVEEGGDADSFVESVSGSDAFADGEESSGTGIDKQDSLIVVDGDNAFDHGVEYGGEECDGGGGVASGLFESENAILELIFELVECVSDITDFILAIGDIQEHIVAIVALYGGLQFPGHDLQRRDDSGGDDEEAESAESPGDQCGLEGDG
jgi:hypothetical protein